MNKLVFLFLITLISFNAKSQEIIKQGCKTEDVTVKAYNHVKLADKAIVVKLNSIRLEKQAKSMDDLTLADLKKIKKWARKFKSCTVYLDFNAELIDQALNPEIKNEDLVYIIVLEQKN